MNEVWRPLVGAEGNYEVSSTGKVRNQHGKLLKPQLDDRGYERLRLSVANTKFSVRVHVAVAKAFIPNPDAKPQVNHKNGVKTDNTVKNLEWMTNEENSKHARETGLQTYKTGAEARAAKRKIRITWPNGLVEEVVGTKALQERGMDYRLVSACLLGKRHTHKLCKFEEVKL